jgi:apolipoprotein N-acyltransferase
MTVTSARLFVLASLTGLLYPFCFPHYEQGWLAWIALVPLHVALSEVRPRRAFWLGWIAGLIAFVGTMFWVVTAMHLYGKMPLVISYAVMLLLAAYLGLYVGLYACMLTWVRDNVPAVGLLAGPFVWVALEWVRTYAFSGLPWALFGYSQYQWLVTIQIADITGVYGVSFVIVLVNVALAEVVLWILRHRETLFRKGASRFRPATFGDFPRTSSIATVLICALMLGYGVVRLTSFAQDSDGASERTIKIGLVQPNIDQGQKWDDAYRRQTMDRYARLTKEVAPGSSLLIWPEAATPFLFEREVRYRLQVATLVHSQGVPLLFGSPALRYYTDGRPYLLNSAYLFSSDGDILGRYDKQHLVPFGEYIPLHRLLFFLDKLVEGIGDFAAGTIPTVLTVPESNRAPGSEAGTKFGVVICFEVIFPNLVREFVRDGAEFMVTITNDAWFGDSVAPYQHFGMVVLRAVENRIAFARAANTGISGFIDPQGRVLTASSIFAEAVMRGEIPLKRQRAFYTRYGDVFAYGCVIITGIFLAAAAWRRAAHDQRSPRSGRAKVRS